MLPFKCPPIASNDQHNSCLFPGEPPFGFFSSSCRFGSRALHLVQLSARWHSPNAINIANPPPPLPFSLLPLLVPKLSDHQFLPKYPTQRDGSEPDLFFPVLLLVLFPFLFLGSIASTLCPNSLSFVPLTQFLASFRPVVCPCGFNSPLNDGASLVLKNLSLNPPRGLVFVGLLAPLFSGFFNFVSNWADLPRYGPLLSDP